MGIKIGFSNRDMWPKYRVAAPVFGYVYHRTHRSLEVAGTVVRASRFLHPRIEPEVVVFLREIPPEEAGADMLPGAIEAIAPALEVVQCASPVWCFDACGAIMQNALHGQLLVGERFPLGPAPRPMREICSSRYEPPMERAFTTATPATCAQASSRRSG